MKLRIPVALCAVVLAAGAAGAQTPARTPMRAQAMDTVVRKRLSARYLLYLPRDYGHDPRRRWPLIVYLHGGSLRGANVDTVRTWGVPRVAERDPAFPFIVVAPQADAGTLWTDTDVLIAILDRVIASHAVDPSRVYLTGYSMGGNGAWYLAYMHPERFAAIAPMSGPANVWWAGRLAHTPVWAFHGARDEIVPVRESREMVRALQAAGNRDVRYTELPDRDHGLLDLYENRELYAWFLRHRRP